MTDKKRVRLKLGDVFEVPLSEGKVGYFQYISDDLTQLNSYVIRVFRAHYVSPIASAIEEIASGDVHFYAHVFLKVGLKFDFWKKIGNASPPAGVNVLFRGSDDYGNPEIKVSQRWYVWNINEPFRHVGVLTPEYQDAEIGSVKAPQDIIERMETGSYGYFYPGY